MLLPSTIFLGSLITIRVVCAGATTARSNVTVKNNEDNGPAISLGLPQIGTTNGSNPASIEETRSRTAIADNLHSNAVSLMLSCSSKTVCRETSGLQLASENLISASTLPGHPLTAREFYITWSETLQLQPFTTFKTLNFSTFQPLPVTPASKGTIISANPAAFSNVSFSVYNAFVYQRHSTQQLLIPSLVPSLPITNEVIIQTTHALTVFPSTTSMSAPASLPKGTSLKSNEIYDDAIVWENATLHLTLALEGHPGDPLVTQTTSQPAMSPGTLFTSSYTRGMTAQAELHSSATALLLATPAPRMVIESTTLSVRGEAAQIRGALISLASSAIIIASSTLLFSKITASANELQDTGQGGNLYNAQTFTVAGQLATLGKDLQVQLIVGSMTIAPGQTGGTIHGTPISLESTAVIFGTSTIGYSLDSTGFVADYGIHTTTTVENRTATITPTVSRQCFAIMGTVYTAPLTAETGFSIGGSTIRLGGPAATVASTPVSLATFGLIVGNSTIPFVSGSSITSAPTNSARSTGEVITMSSFSSFGLRRAPATMARLHMLAMTMICYCFISS